MKKNLLHLVGIGAGLLIVVTLIYAATENRITEIRKEGEITKFLQESPLVLIEFYSPSCPVCNAFKKKRIFPDSAAQLPHVKFAMISSDEGEALHHAHKITQFPTFIYFKDGKEIKRDVGYIENPMFAQKVSAAFGSAQP